MKTIAALLLATTVALIGWRLVTPDDAPPSPQRSSQSHREHNPPSQTTTDSLKIFRSAFWRSPLAGDEILNAERHEWSDQDGLNRWQWFIALRPSPELVKCVRDENAFGLAKSDSPEFIDHAPAWFSPDPTDVMVLRSSRSNLQFIFSRSDNTLYATNSGNGFTPGAPQRTRPVVSSSPRPGRLPRTPPPSSRHSGDPAL